MTVIVDAAPLIAMGDRGDPRHVAVRRFVELESSLLVIPATVTAEADYLIHRRGGPAPARRFLQDLADGRFRVESLTRDEHGLALALHDRYAGFALGLADLSIIVLAHRFRTNRLLTFDERHFRSVAPILGGAFTLLPADL